MAGRRATRAWRPFISGLLAICVALLPACAHRNGVLADAANAAVSTGSPYAGLALGDDVNGGAVVIDVIAGPAALAGLLPGDKIEHTAGEKASAARLLDMIRGSHPGTRLPLHVIRGESRCRGTRACAATRTPATHVR